MSIATRAENFSSTPRPLISTHARSQISHLVHRDKAWHGTRQGIKIQITLDTQPNLDGHAFAWRARVPARTGGHEWREGVADSVFAALLEIERQADQARRAQLQNVN